MTGWILWTWSKCHAILVYSRARIMDLSILKVRGYFFHLFSKTFPGCCQIYTTYTYYTVFTCILCLDVFISEWVAGKELTTMWPPKMLTASGTDSGRRGDHCDVSCVGAAWPCEIAVRWRGKNPWWRQWPLLMIMIHEMRWHCHRFQTFWVGIIIDGQHMLSRSYDCLSSLVFATQGL